jgi:hypothetical protein
MANMHNGDGYVRLEKRTYADGGLSGALSSGCGDVSNDIPCRRIYDISSDDLPWDAACTFVCCQLAVHAKLHSIQVRVPSLLE